MSGSASSSHPADGSAPPLPLRIPDHELLRKIGRGAYGEVWLARSVTGAYRAVKVVRRESFDHDRPFEREFEGILKFEPISRQHHSQVDILHVGRSGDSFYYVMELADDQATGGQINSNSYTPRTLKSDLLFRGRIPFEECVRIGLALATALEHLHDCGLVHRDVKPSNIIFVNGVAKLADIGLVTGMDATRSYVGTEGFAAPEGPGTAQADLYSLGKVLYEMATGKDRQEFPDLPTQLRELPDREGLMELNTVIARACRHNPKDRYTSAAAMRADLELLQGGKSLARLHRVERQLRVLRRAGVAVAALTLLISAGWLYQGRQTRIVRELANANARLANEKSKLADDSRERLVRLHVANGARVLEEEPAAALLWFSQALPLVTNSPAESTIHRMRIQQLLDSLPVPILVLAQEHSIMASAFSDDGQLFVISTITGEVAVGDARSGIVQWEYQADFPVFQARFSRDRQRLFLASSRPPNSGSLDEPSVTGFAVIDLARPNPIISEVTGSLRSGSRSNDRLRAAFSPNDRWVALAESNHTIRITDARDGQTALRLPGHTAEITMFSFSADGNLLASASRDQTVRLWRLPSGEPVGDPLPHSIRVKRVALSGDGKRLATLGSPPGGGTNWSMQVWEVETGRGIGPPIPVVVSDECLFGFLDEAGTKLLFASDSGPADRRGWLMNIETGEQVVLPGIQAPRCMAFSRDSRRVAVGEKDDGYVRVFNAQTGELLLAPIRYRRSVQSLNFSGDGSRLLATTSAGAAMIWRLPDLPAFIETHFEATIPKGSRKAYLELILNLSQRRIVLPLSDGTIRVMDLDRFVELRTLRPTDTTGIPSFAASPDGHHWAAHKARASRWEDEEAAPEAVDLWSEDNGALRHFLLPHPMPAGEMRFDATSSSLLTHCQDQHIRFWRAKDGNLERSITLPDDVKRHVDFFPDGKTALGRQRESSDYQLFDLTEGRPLGRPIPIRLPYDISAFDFDLPSGRFATAVSDNYTRIWNGRTGELLLPPLPQNSQIECVAWSPDRRRIMAAGWGGTKIWDAKTGEIALALVKEISGSAEVATWSLDGRFIVAPVGSNSARVYDANTGEAVTPLIRAGGYIRLATMVGNRLILLSDPNRLQTWDLHESSLPVTLISDFARLLSGHRLNAAGVPVALEPSEHAKLFHALRQRAPELFQE